MNRRVLVVDDEPIICEVVQAVLSSAGMDVLAVSDSQEAARHLLREKFDAVFLDVRMPDPDGIELARRARSTGFNQRTPIVMITGFSDPAVHAQAFQAGANFFLYKPIDRRRLLRILRVTQGSIQQERRRFQRVAVRCKAVVETGTQRLEGSTLDLSLNGALLELPGVLPVGAQANIALELKQGGPTVRAVGRIARLIGEDCMGVELVNVSTGDSEQLQEFLLPLILAAAEKESAT